VRDSKRVRWAVAAVVAMLALFVSAGCGGGEDGEPSTQCKAETENAARAAVIAEAYEQGRIGTKAQVDAAFPGDQSLFDADGHMLQYSELKGIMAARFDEWVANGPYIHGEVQREAFAAQEQVREDGWPDC
jgi:hypothetical protein